MHIAYVSMGAMGHVLAALPFCGALKKMGHRVSFFTAEFLREQVEAFGVDFYPYNLFVLRSTVVGEDIEKNDFLEHIE